MCGICGFIGKAALEAGAARDIIGAMNAAIRHRGPDDSGEYLSAQDGLALGHQRLSIIDLEGGHQPLADAEGRYWIVFNGEIYNFQSLRQSLQQRGHVFKTHSDTEVILSAYREWGEACLGHLRGMFAFAIWDSQAKTMFCGRDRLGIKPFYYYWDGSTFVFASEIKAILAHPSVTTSLSTTAVSEYLQLQYITAPNTVFSNIYKLPAGHSLMFKDQAIAVEQYWQLNPQTIARSEEEAIAALREQLDEAIALHMHSDVPLGAFLSGGTDSSAVVGLMAGHSNAPIQTHTAVFREQDHDERLFAQQIAQRFHTDHVESQIGVNLAQDLSKILWHMDEPFADASAVPSYYLSQATRQRVKVSLSGDGGDELFCGYNWYSELARLQTLSKWLPASLLKCFGKSFAGGLPATLRGTTMLRNLGEPGWRQHFNLRNYFSGVELTSLLDDQSIQACDVGKSYERYHAHWNHEGLDRVKRAQLVDMQTYMVEDILMKIDKTSMAHGLEVRVPLLDHKVVELAVSLPTAFNLKGSRRKCALKNSVSDCIPAAFLDRKKHGFSAPVEQWLKHDLKELAGDLLLSSSSRQSGLFNQKAVTNLWVNLHQGRGHVGIVERCWAILCFELWYETYSRQCTQLQSGTVKK